MQAMAQQLLTHLSIFNLPAFSELPDDNRRYERIDVECDGRFVGTLAGVIVGETFVSGYGASFGGMDFIRERETLEIIMRAIDDTVEQIRRLGVAQICVHSKPFHYSRNEEYLHFALCRSGFVVAEVNLNLYLDLERFPTPDAYRTGLRHAPQRQLRLAIAAELDWREASSQEDWVTAYEVLAESRRRNRATLSLSFEYLVAMRATFSERVRMFLLENEGHCIAAVLLYAVTPRHAMVMYWGDRGDRMNRTSADQSPVAVMNLVAYRMIEAGLNSGFRTIDLGPVSTNERVNIGNARFKASINAIPNIRYTLTRTL